MNPNTPDGPAPTHTEPASLFGALDFPAEAYCEALGSGATPRRHWQPLMAAFDAIGPDALRQRQERVRRMRHEDGATFNPFDDAGGGGTPWALEMIPLPIIPEEWAVVETGLIQRARLLEMILADVYGDQRLLKEGQLPAALVFANAHFLHPCHGIRPFGGRFLSFYAADLYRGASGRFTVLRDYGANPAGLGYALENRIVISRSFSELYHKTQIRRLAPFFHAFHRNLIQRAALQRKEPGIVLLSPGPDSRIYFEQALLSRYLGYPLVEGQDLTVRNGRVFLKKLAGLESVEVILRHIADHRSDPFALRKQSVEGVAGLIQACREQHIDVVNPIGSGFVDTPVLPVFLPGICRALLGEPLALDNHPAWWCGNAEGLSQALAHLDQWRIASAMDRTAPAVSPQDLESAIQADPHLFMAQGPILPAAVPAWDRNRVTSRFALLRVFVCATEQGFEVMPGGLAITAADVETLVGDNPERQQSKDIWVLSDKPVAPFSLMSGLQKVPEFRRSSDLPSRVADHLLWLGRYLERAEGLVRLLRSVFRRLSGEARLVDIPEFLFLLNLLRAQNTIQQPSEAGDRIPRFRELTALLNDALYGNRPESVVSVLKQVREAARYVRDRLSLDSWRVINRLEGFADKPAGDPLELLDDTLFTLSAFSGLAMESMTRGLGWRFMDMGRRLERGITQVGLIRAAFPQMCAQSRSALEALLEVADSIMTYRARYRTTFQLAAVLDLLLVDESNPKSLAFQCSQISAHVENLPRQGERRFATADERMALEILTAVRLLDLTGLDCSAGPQNESLAEFLETMEKRLLQFAQQISAHYLSRVSATPHFSLMQAEDAP